jgi:hypothetical protein
MHIHDNVEISLNLCLIELQKYFLLHGKRCQNLSLPEPLNYDYEDLNEYIVIYEENKIASSLYKTLNKDQLHVGDTLSDKASDFPPNKNPFFLDGPGLYFIKF